MNQIESRTNVHSAPMPRLIRIKEAATYLGMSEWSLRNLAHRGEVPFIQVTAQSPMMFDWQDLDEWIEKTKYRR